MTCPKCDGTGFIRSDEWGTYWTCFTCSAQRDLIQSHGNGYATLMREPALGVRGMMRPQHIEPGSYSGQRGG